MNGHIAGTMAETTRIEPVNPQEFYEVQIVKVVNGFVIRVGCKTFVAKTWKEASASLGEYFDDPVKARIKFCGKGN